MKTQEKKCADNINERALISANLELEQLQKVRPRTPEQHRALREKIESAGLMISLVRYVEREAE